MQKNRILPTSKRSSSRHDFEIENNNLSTSKRSQSAIEFVILVGFVLFFFVTFILVVQGNISDKMREKKNFAIKEIAMTVQDEINLASESTDGYSRVFKIPENLNGQDYDIIINEGMVYVHTLDNKYTTTFPVADVTGIIQKGENIIKKENGKVLLN